MIYFDNGATTFPKPQSVINAVSRAMRTCANPGRSGHRLSVRSSEIIFECRQNTARLFDFDKPENVIFTNNCTAALNTVIRGTLKEGDHVIISSLEHNAVLRPVADLKDRGVEYSVASVIEGDNDKTLDNFRSQIKGNTRMVVCTHASNVFGVRLPIERIGAMCRIYGILFCVDAAQTAGVMPISLKDSDIDYLCTAGHKGLYGPMGTGVLVINSETTPKSLIQGGTGSFSSELAQPDVLPDKYESGTPNVSGIAGLNEGVKFVLNKGISNIRAHETDLAQRLYNGLSKNSRVILYTEPPSSGGHAPVISFNIKGRDSAGVAETLNQRFNIAVRAGLHCAPLAHQSLGTAESGTVRAVMSVFNSAPQIDYFLNSVNKIATLTSKKVAIDT